MKQYDEEYTEDELKMLKLFHAREKSYKEGRRFRNPYLDDKDDQEDDD